MKKNGFTLAEVLITLGIVGVIAAITLPSLMADTTAAQIGPKLAKTIAAFEQANETLLNSNAVNTLVDSGHLTNNDMYYGELSKFLKISKSGNGFLLKDGIKIDFTINETPPTNTSDPAYKQRIGDVKVDINGATKPNTNGTDIFHFSWWNDGSLRPKGSTNWDGTTDSTDGGNKHWKKQCPENGLPSSDDAYTYCAGHIFENNFKVLYK